MEYFEEYHKTSLPPFSQKSYYKTGQIESLLEITSKKKLNFIVYEYYENGTKKMDGTMKYDMNRYDYYKTGTWIYYNDSGSESKHETYSDGKVVKSKDF